MTILSTYCSLFGGISHPGNNCYAIVLVSTDQETLQYEIKFVIIRFAQRLPARLTIQIIVSVLNLEGCSAAVLPCATTRFKCQSNWPFLNKKFDIGESFLLLLYIYVLISQNMPMPYLFALFHVSNNALYCQVTCHLALFIATFRDSRLSLFHFSTLKLHQMMLKWHYTNHDRHI